MAVLGTQGIVCAVRGHGEHGSVVRLLTHDHGLVAGYVRGGRSRRLRPVLMPGNIVEAELRARTPDQLAAMTAELVTSRAPWHGEPLASAAIAWSTALVAATLPENNPYPAIHLALHGLLDAICHATSARAWSGGLAAFETLLLRELGYGEGGRGAAPRDWAATRDALRRSGAALELHLFADRRSDALAARALLIDRLSRAIA